LDLNEQFIKTRQSRKNDRESMLHALEASKMHPQLCLEKMKERDHLEDKAVGGRIRLTWILKKI
jgi:hypothetical protein